MSHNAYYARTDDRQLVVNYNPDPFLRLAQRQDLMPLNALYRFHLACYNFRIQSSLVGVLQYRRGGLYDYEDFDDP